MSYNSPISIQTIFKKLVHIIKATPVEIYPAIPGVRISFGAEGEYAEADEYNPPLILLARDAHDWTISKRQKVSLDEEKIISSSKCLLNDLHVLAHEFGHHQSAANSCRSTEYKKAIKIPPDQWPGALNPKQIKLIFEEERLAWSNAQKTLASLNYNGWSDFEMKRDDALNEYKRRL